MGNGSRYFHTHYAIPFLVNSIHVFSHLCLKSAIKCTTVTCAHNQWWHSKKESNISARSVTCAQNQWQKHYTNLRHLLQKSIAHKINVEILNRKIIKESPCFSSNLHTKSIIKYASYKNLRNLPRQLLSCKISYKNALKPSITSSAAVSHVRSLRSNVRKASKISYPLYPLHSYLWFEQCKKISLE